MSLWTPGGEHEVPRERPTEQPAAAPGPSPAGMDDDALAAALGIPSLADLSDEERAQLEQAVAQMAETERQLQAFKSSVRHALAPLGNHANANTDAGIDGEENAAVF